MKMKFRIWDEEKNKMYQLGTETEVDLFQLFKSSVESEGLSFYENSSKKYMMCTELKDKNGREVYEGDILKTSIKEGEIITYVLFYQFGWHEKLISSPLNHWNDYFGFRETVKTMFSTEIIGNIYENKEWLNV